MHPLTHRERFLNSLHRRPVDQFACGDNLWADTLRRYVREGHLRDGDDVVAHFDMSWRSAGWLNSTADLAFKPVTLEETEETYVSRNGNGATMRHWKNRSGTPEHIAFDVTDRTTWEALIKPHLLDLDRRRVNFEQYREQRAAAEREQRAFTWSGVAPFEQIHPVCGHEHMLAGMALDPGWVLDMAMTFADLTIRHLETLFAEEGDPDAMWFYEDMGFKEKPFMSPAMYAELIEPAHQRLFDFAHSRGLKVIVHSCGFVEPLVPGMIRAGMDCLQAMEVKAGMDLPRLFKAFGDRIAFCGGIDIREVETNRREAITAELRRKIGPLLDGGGGYILHSDHSIPPTVDYETLQFFLDHGRQMPQWASVTPRSP